MNRRVDHLSLSFFALAVAVATGCSSDPTTNGDMGATTTTASTLIAAEDCLAGSVDGKVGICHATGSTTNRYVHIRVSTQGCINGHAQHPGDFVSDDPSCNPCVPSTCAAEGKDCGTIPDGCGGSLDCGTCAAPQTCAGAGSSNVCGLPCPGTGGPTMVRLPEGYCIDSTEVTRAQYQAWLDTSPSAAGQISGCTWKMSFVPSPICMSLFCQSGCDDHPQVCVTWCDAYAYCQGVGKRLCGKIGGGSTGFDDYANASLSQWYNACASGGANKTYPYGNTYQGNYCNGQDDGLEPMTTTPVGSMTTCQSSVSGYQGVYDLSGNVGEWEDSCNGADQWAGCRVRGGTPGADAVHLSCAYGIDAPRRSGGGFGIRCCAP
jgi:hypothetical protein